MKTQYNINPDFLNLRNQEFDDNKSIYDQKSEKSKQLAEQLEGLERIAEGYKQKGAKTLFRFNNGPEALQSVAQKQNQQFLPDEIKRYFAQQHMTRNLKSLRVPTINQDQGDTEYTTYYSPFLSTTENLKNFTNTAFASSGDANVRQDIFHRAPNIGIFNVPENYTISPKMSNSNSSGSSLPELESEVLWDSSTGENLNNYMKSNQINPLLDQIGVLPMQLYTSRGFNQNDNNTPITPLFRDNENWPQSGNQLFEEIRSHEEKMRAIPKKTKLEKPGILSFQDLQTRAKELEDLMFLYDPSSRIVEYYNPSSIPPAIPKESAKFAKNKRLNLS